MGGDSRVLAQSVFGRGPDAPVTTVRVALSAHLRTLARVGGEVKIEVAEPPTLTTVLDALESRYPMLRGTARCATTERTSDARSSVSSRVDVTSRTNRLPHGSPTP